MAEVQTSGDTPEQANMSPGNEDTGKDSTDNEEGKMFVGGLNWETTEDGLRNYFSKYGDVISVTIKFDPVTRRSRGFAFVTFADPYCVDKVLANGPHQLDNRTVDPKRALPLEKQIQLKGQHRTKKIFIGGLGAEHTEATLKDFFSEFGNITEIEFVTDKVTKKRRGFCFLSFDTEDAVDRACDKQFYSICGRKVEIKRATPKEQANRMKNMQYPGFVGAPYAQTYPGYYQGFPYAAYPTYATTYVGYQPNAYGAYGSMDYQYSAGNPSNTGTGAGRGRESVATYQDSSSRFGPVRAAGYAGSQVAGYHPYSR